jgi:hypothetical protein
MMYNPPWTLALAMPIGAVNFHIARSIWLPVAFLWMTPAVAVACYLLNRRI